jgi:hypothetical protein
MKTIHFAAVAVLFLGIFAPRLAKAQYTATLLPAPSGISDTVAEAVSGNSQVGTGSGSATGGSNHALRWSGTAVDLNPAGFTQSEALGVSGNSQVRYGFGSGTGGISHALLWNGTASSFACRSWSSQSPQSP